MSTQETKLKAIADAIREKDGTTAPIPANDFPARIRAIPSGGLPDNVRTITLTADPPEGGTVSGGGYASDGMTLIINAEANEADNYLFDGWKENDTVVSAEPLFTFPVTGNRTLVAAFAEKHTSRLPDGYTEVKYITGASSNNSYIQFNKKLGSVLSTDIEFWAAAEGSKYISYGTYGNSNLLFYLSFNAGYLNLRLGGAASTSNIKVVEQREFHVCKFYGNQKTLYLDEDFKTVTIPSYPALNSLYTQIYVNNTTKLYYLRNKENEYIPCIRSDGTPGIYCLQEDLFLTSTGSGQDIVAGPAV